MTDTHCHACEQPLKTHPLTGTKVRGESWDIVKHGSWEYLYSLCKTCYRATSEINNNHRKYK